MAVETPIGVSSCCSSAGFEMPIKKTHGGSLPRPADPLDQVHEALSVLEVLFSKGAKPHPLALHCPGLTDNIAEVLYSLPQPADLSPYIHCDVPRPVSRTLARSNAPKFENLCSG